MASPSAKASIAETGRAVAALLNSRPHAIHGDRLADAAYVEQLVARLAPGTARKISSKQLARLRAVREALVEVVAGNHDKSRNGWSVFNRQTEDVTFRYVVGAPGDPTALQQVSGDPVIGAVVKAVAELSDSGNWSRLRVCANEVCSGIFYDATRSRSQKWDSYETCGNRVNVNAYRQRLKAAPEH